MCCPHVELLGTLGHSDANPKELWLRGWSQGSHIDWNFWVPWCTVSSSVGLPLNWEEAQVGSGDHTPVYSLRRPQVGLDLARRETAFKGSVVSRASRAQRSKKISFAL